MEKNQNPNEYQDAPGLPTQPQVSGNPVTPEATQTQPVVATTPQIPTSPTTPAPSPSIPPTPQAPRSNKMLKIGLFLMLLVLLGTGGYILIQNQTIREKLLPAKTTPIPSQTPVYSPTQTPIPSPTPTPTQESIVEPQVTTPLPNSKITSPLVVKGKVPAGWMFEGQFPIQLLDSDRNLITSGTGKETIPGSWNSGKSVDFQATLTFATASSSGYLVLSNDNPSGLPSNAKSFEIPVTF